MNRSKNWLAAVLLLVLIPGCWAWIPVRENPAAGLFRVLAYEPDGTLVISGQHRLRLYGIKIVQTGALFEQTFNTFVGQTIWCSTKGYRLVQQEGTLHYRKDYDGDPSSLQGSALLMERDLTPKRDKEGRVLVLALTTWHPPMLLQETLLLKGIAKPDPELARSDPEFYGSF